MRSIDEDDLERYKDPETVVLVDMFVAARLIGLLGAIITVPALASGIEVVRYLYLKVLGEEPFPPQQDQAPQTSGAS